MCGIHFILSPDKSRCSQIQDFLSFSAHRGPNGRGSFYGITGTNFFEIGHNLLAVVGNISQPLIEANYAITFNGEIYNYRALAEKYGMDRFQNDTEILAALLYKFGSTILGELEGMFAFVFLNFDTNKILVGRDFFGQKPVFYYHKNGEFAVSSESKNLQIFGESTIEKEELREILLYKHIPLGKSIYNEVFSLEPGHFLELSPNGELKKDSFGFQESISEKEDLRKLIQKSMAEQCPDIQSPAVYLSGGLDSSILLYELKEMGKTPIAYTLDTSADSSFATQDLEYASQLCKSLGVEHRVVKVSRENLETHLETLDTPVGDGAFLLQSVLAKEIVKKHNFALCGNGADELFGGYQRHWAFEKYLVNKTLLSSSKDFLSAFTFMLGEQKKSYVKRSLEKIHKNEYLTFLNFLELNFELESQKESKADFCLEAALEYDINNYLVQDVLSIGDQSAMSHGLELRAPFLSREIYQYSQRLEAKEKIKKGGKFHLKEIYADVDCLKPILERKKQGFGIPFLAFWGEDKLVELQNLISELLPFLSAEDLEKIKSKIAAGKDAFSNEYWTLWILCNWLKRNK